jgi:tRNA pseudouridine38-40 synthase
MRREARCLLGRHDFKSFCASGSATRDTVRTIRRISVKKLNYPLFTIHYPLIAIDIEADGFLYNMARSIAGTLIEIGKGKLTQGALKKILQAKNRKLAGPTVPAAGLYLVKVNY